MCKVRPIIFSGDSVRAILSSTKTQTRRVIKHDRGADRIIWIDNGELFPNRSGDERPWCGWVAQIDALNGLHLPISHIPGKVGDRLWVKEKWKSLGAYPDNAQVGIEYAAGGRAHYETSDWAKYMPLDTAWRSTLFMPRWASRITLEITGVRVQRVQDISHEDAIVEGCSGCDWIASSPYFPSPHTDSGQLPVEEFQERWDRLNGKKHPWASNPWIWIIEFKVMPPPST